MIDKVENYETHESIIDKLVSQIEIKNTGLMTEKSSEILMKSNLNWEFECNQQQAEDSAQVSN